MTEQPDLTLVTPTRLTLLDTAHWLTGDGRIVAVDQLSDQHRINLLAWLRPRAAWLADYQDSHDYQLYLLEVLTADQYIARQRARRDLTAEVWLEETPLVRRLVELSRPTPSRLRGPR